MKIKFLFGDPIHTSNWDLMPQNNLLQYPINWIWIIYQESLIFMLNTITQWPLMRREEFSHGEAMNLVDWDRTHLLNT